MIETYETYKKAKNDCIAWLTKAQFEQFNAKLSVSILGLTTPLLRLDVTKVLKKTAFFNPMSAMTFNCMPHFGLSKPLKTKLVV